MIDRLQDIRERLEAATPGPWEIEHDRIWANTDDLALNNQIASVSGSRPWMSDAEFIAHAPDDIEFLLAEVERLQEDLAIAQDALDEAGSDLHNWQEAYYDDIHRD